MSTNLLVFATAAFFEITGCFAFWTWLRRGASPFVAVLGVGSLVAFAVALTRVNLDSRGGLLNRRLFYESIAICRHERALTNIQRVSGDGVLHVRVA